MPRGIYPRPTTMERFNESFYIDQKGCWIWTKADRGNGYGASWYKGKIISAHRLGLLLYKNISIDDNNVADHLCRVPKCVNPDHLEMVTHRENILRGDGVAAVNSKKTHCQKGHDLYGENLYKHNGKRYCKKCVKTNSMKGKEK